MAIVTWMALAAVLPAQAPRFEPLPGLGLPLVIESTSAMALGGVYGDGDLDLAMGDRGTSQRFGPSLGTSRLYRNDGGGHYTDASSELVLPPFGTFGLDPATTIALPPVLIPQPAGVTQVTIQVPNLPGLVGLPVFGQALVVPWPFAARFTNGTADAIQ